MIFDTTFLPALLVQEQVLVPVPAQEQGEQAAELRQAERAAVQAAVPFCSLPERRS